MRNYFDDPPSETKFAKGLDTVVIVLPAQTMWIHCLDWLMWSFVDKPAAGLLTIADTTNNVILHEVEITNKSHKDRYFRLLAFGPKGFVCPEHVTVTITLSSDTSVMKRLTIQHR